MMPIPPAGLPKRQLKKQLWNLPQTFFSSAGLRDR